LRRPPIPYRQITLQLDAGVATLALAAPASANAITPTMIWEVRDALERVAADEGLRALILTAVDKAGAGDVFSSGFTPEAAAAALDEAPERQPPQLLAALRVPTVAALFGTVAGAALELALACDLRVAAADATLVFPQLGEGRLPNWGGTQRLARLVGIGRALELILLGEPLPAAAALACGLVTRLVSRAELLPETRRLVAGWQRGAPIALAYLKEAVRQGGDLPLDHALRLEWDLAVLLETTRDRAEGIRAFLEKRPPHFTGE